jgi:hypothetical protein
MKLTIKQLRQAIRESLEGSQPEENYSRELVDDKSLDGESLLVNDETKKKLRSYFKSMGLSTH